MRVLHILDHSLPVMSGYSTRSHNILTFQRRLGLQPVVLTSPKHPRGGPPCETRESIPYYRTQRSTRKRTLPYASELVLMARFARRIGDVARAEGVKVLHAHSPVLNGLPAIWAARRLGVPSVYESRAFWEDAAVDHGTTRENSVRYRVTRALETLADNHTVLVNFIQVTESRYGVGVGGQQDVLKARVEAARLAEEAVMLNEQRRAALARLNAALDRPSDTPVEGPRVPERVGQLGKNCAKPFTNQAARAASLHGAADLARGSNAKAHGASCRASQHHEDQAVDADALTARLHFQEFSTLADAVRARRNASSGPRGRLHYFW